MPTKTAIVYDWIDKWGGVERLLLNLHEIFPEAEFYTSYLDRRGAGWARDLNIKTSFIQKLTHFIKKSRTLSLPFYPYAFEKFDFTDYDQVISVTSSFAKSIITKPGTKHICYLLTPPRYLWGMEDEYRTSALPSFMQNMMREKLRKFDFIAAQRPDEIISLSKSVAKRCQKYYRRDSEVMYPPFDLQYWNKLHAKSVKLAAHFKKYYLVVSRLEPYKKIGLVIQTFNSLQDLNLVIVGDGSLKQKLKNIAGKNIHFTGKVSDEELVYLYQNAEALIMAQEEDFGYTSLEAQFQCCPVITYARGGGSETVVDGETGVHFETQSEKGLIEGLDRFHTIAYNVKNSLEKTRMKHLSSFSKEQFAKNLKSAL